MPHTHTLCVMDRTSITLGSETRNQLRDYKKDRDLDNYDEAVQDLLGTQEVTP